MDHLRHPLDGLLARLERILVKHAKRSHAASPSTKVALRNLLVTYREQAESGHPLPPLRDTGFSVFSQTDEDGIILFLLALIGMGPRTFVDIGGGDGVHASNCANLALNLGFHGLIIDADEASIRRGKAFYGRHPDTSLYPPKFVHAAVTKRNVNQLIEAAGFEGEVDLLSIDIDGNDYWIWEAITCIQPRIVLIETHIEFGMDSVAVPYREDFKWERGMNPHYLGASPAAMTKLAGRLGYRLVGANRFGFNTFYLREDLQQHLIPTLDVTDLFSHPRNREVVLSPDEVRALGLETV